MLFLIILLSVAMVIDCVLMVFLVLMQLPKKEAGVGVAFGGGATDALFGAGSGNVLTKATKYTAGIFFALAIVLSVLQSRRAHQPGSDFMQRVKETQNTQPTITAPPTPTAPPPSAAAPPPISTPSSNLLMVAPESTSPPATSSNAAPAQPK